MPLTMCPDCGNKVSASAPVCPHCGRPLAPGLAITRRAGGIACPHCGANEVRKVQGFQGVGECALGFTLLLLGLIPGVIYYAYVESIPYCTGCGRRVRG